MVHLLPICDRLDAPTGQARELCSPRSDSQRTLLLRPIPSLAFGTAPLLGRHPPASSSLSPCAGATSARPTELVPLHARAKAGPQPRTRTVCLRLSGRRGASSAPPLCSLLHCHLQMAGSCFSRWTHCRVQPRLVMTGVYPSLNALAGGPVCCCRTLMQRTKDASILSVGLIGRPQGRQGASGEAGEEGSARRWWRRKEEITSATCPQRMAIRLPAAAGGCRVSLTARMCA